MAGGGAHNNVSQRVILPKPEPTPILKQEPYLNGGGSYDGSHNGENSIPHVTFGDDSDIDFQPIDSIIANAQLGKGKFLAWKWLKLVQKYLWFLDASPSHQSVTGVIHIPNDVKLHCLQKVEKELLWFDPTEVLGLRCDPLPQN